MFIRDLHCKSPREGVSISFDYLDFVWAPSCIVQRKPVYVCDECNFFCIFLIMVMVKSPMKALLCALYELLKGCKVFDS